MPKIAQSNRTNGHMVFEDPRAGNATIYLQTHAHEMTSLSPLFGKYMSSDTDGSLITPQGINSTLPSSSSSNPVNPPAGSIGCMLQLTKDTIHVYQGTYVAGNVAVNNIDVSQFYSIDPAEPAHTLRLFTGGGDTEIMSANHGHQSGQWNNIQYWHNPGATELYDTKPGGDISGLNNVYAATGPNAEVSSVRRMVHLDTSSKTLVGIASRGNYNAPSMQIEYPRFQAAKSTGFPYNSSTMVFGPSITNYHGVWMGMSTDNKGLYFLQDHYTAGTFNHKIYKYDIGNNTGSYTYEWTVIGTTAGGHTGARTVASASSTVANHFFTPSKFHDTATATTKAFYVPSFDSSQNYYPHYFTWDTTNDTVTRFSDTSTRNTADSAAYASSTDFNNFQGSQWGWYKSAKSSICFNETFFWTATSTRYMLLGVITGQVGANDGNDTARTFVTFTIDGSDPKKILYHSKFTVPATAKNMVFLNDARTLLAVVMENQTNLYSFTPATGFALATELSLKVWALGRDRLDRIWAATAGISSTYADLHLITPSLPVTVNIVPAASTYNYTGTTLNSNFTLATLDTTGARVSTDVTLVIDGSTITFSDDTKSKIITTSAAGDVTVNIKIVDSGFSQIISSVTI